MKIKKEFVLRTIDGINIVVAVGKEASAHNSIITLNDTGAFLWRALESGCEKSALTEKLCGEYDVSSDIASADVDGFVAKLADAGILE